MDWPREIVIAHRVKQEIARVDQQELWSHHYPEVAATEAEVSAVEAHLGFPLDPQYREFLRYADGWKCFHHDDDLFSTRDLMGSPEFARAAELLDSLEDLKSICGFSRSELLPFAMSGYNIDVFAMTTPSSRAPGLVFWLAGGLIESFPGFNEWFLSMVDYNRLEYQRLVDDSEI